MRFALENVIFFKTKKIYYNININNFYNSYKILIYSWRIDSSSQQIERINCL